MSSVKFFCAFLALFVLFLSVQPVCGMTLSGSSDGCCESSFIQDEDDQDQPPHEECRNCNPFQACTCCAPAVMPVPELLLAKHEASPITKTRNVVANVDCPQGQGSGFWQPPRVA